ncbi:hypothetical protein AVEN_271357-1 [Araneus ventricosus]|uniref:Integrase zinc-binding domain-containing protein n=1 Tax=Araneus ventricosus TaxID=182803 RepID=A0A4Y2LTW5_ARAVE|nr:hypothetical protein AVEN_271357-1 [Araneus ventricosus]
MKNGASGQTKNDLPALYDELEAKIRPLEILERTQEKYGDFLSPLVESCLPEEILVAWERSRNIKNASQVEDRCLEKLMHFIKQEVKGEEMVELARTGFLSPANQKKKETVNKLDNYPTAATLILVENLHIENYHAGTHLLLSILREKYWIFGGKRTVRKIWNACVKCRQFKNKSPIVDLVSLPGDRVIELIPGKDRLVRTVKLKTQSCTLIRPIQHVFPLEHSGNNLTGLPLQKVQLTELSVNSLIPETPVNSSNPESPVKSPIPDSSKGN